MHVYADVCFLCTCVIRPVAYGLFSVFVTFPFGERLTKATEITKKKKPKNNYKFLQRLGLLSFFKTEKDKQI